MGRNGWITAVLIALFVFACSDKKENRDDWSIYKSKNKKLDRSSKYIKNGFKYYKQRNVRDAYSNLKTAYNYGSSDPLVLFKLAFLMQKMKNYDESLKIYAQVQKSINYKYSGHPYYKRSFINQGNIFYKKRKFKKALKYYWKASKIFKNDKDIAFSLGMVYRRLKNYALSAAYFEKADNEDFRVNFYIASAYQNLKRLNDAIKRMKSAVLIRPNSSKALGALGNYYYMAAEKLQKKKQYENVLDLLKKSKQLFKKAKSLSKDFKNYYTEAIKAVIMKEYAIKKHLGQGRKKL